MTVELIRSEILDELNPEFDWEVPEFSPNIIASKSPCKITCRVCSYSWIIPADKRLTVKVCPMCQKKKKLIEKKERLLIINKEIIEKALTYRPGSKLLSALTGIRNEKVLIQCDQNHIFEMTIYKLEISDIYIHGKNRWCPICSQKNGNSRKQELKKNENLKKTVKEKREDNFKEIALSLGVEILQTLGKTKQVLMRCLICGKIGKVGINMFKIKDIKKRRPLCSKQCTDIWNNKKNELTQNLNLFNGNYPKLIL